MLTSYDAVKIIPGMSRQPVGFLVSLIPQVDAAIKKYLKQDIEQDTRTEYYNGTGTPSLVLGQRPVALDDNLAVYIDQQGYGGQSPTAFSAPALTRGVQYMLDVTRSNTSSKSGMLIRIGGGPLSNFGPSGGGALRWPGGKLGGTLLPYWAIGMLNIKVVYTSGYADVPADLAAAAATLVVFATRIIPKGSLLTSENLGSYGYSAVQMATEGNYPELMTAGQTLKRYRDSTV